MKAVKIIGICAGLGLVVAVAGVLFATGYLTFNHPSRSRFPIRGIDVSHHQGPIRWDEVRAEGISFAYIKATEGVDFFDPRFEENWAAASSAAIPSGAYHFFTFCSPGLQQAEHFTRTVPNAPDSLPPVVDIEFAGNCKNWSSIASIRRELSVFLAEVETAFERKPILYVTRRGYGRIVAGHFTGYRLWVRSIFGVPSLTAGDNWILWQFADKGRLQGISGFVDLNVFRGDREDFDVLRTVPNRSDSEVAPPADEE